MRLSGLPELLLLPPLLTLLTVTGSLGAMLGSSKPIFTVDYKNNEFLMDGKVFRYVAGSLHYFRIPKPLWKDRIQKMKAAGLNAVSTYVEWSLHEPYPGEYNFEDMADLEYFVKLIQDEGMYLLLRPGPYICAERDFGGFPYWLLNVVPRKRLRTNDSNFKKYVAQWFSVLMPKMEPYLYGNGGNIIMVQVENEYGSYYACDQEYMIWLRDLYKSYVGYKALLYTTDGCGYSYFTCGAIPEVYATVDFGSSVLNVSQCFQYMRKTQQRGPLVNSEFYPGWLSHWGESNPVVPSDQIIKSMKDMLALNASFSFYMFHGGTNFGFTSGANTNRNTSHSGFQPQLTSYDYNAPLNEAGDPTEKYFKIKQALEEASFEVSNEISPVPSPKGDYGKLTLEPLASFFEKITQRVKPVTSDVPLAFEDMDVNTGFVMYETILTDEQKNFTGVAELKVKTVRDRAIVYLDQKQQGTMYRAKGNTTMKLNINPAVEKLSILVENQGRVNYGSFLEDRKGIFDPVKLGNQTLGPWKMIPYPLNETSWIPPIEPLQSVQLPAYFKTEFVLPENSTKCLDTFLDPSGWTKGVAFLNGINLGRYWPANGPQVTLYVPSVYLVPPPANNTLIMLELEGAPQDLSVKLVDKQNLDKPVAEFNY